MKWEEVLGTIAGDDTVFVAMENAEGVKAFLKRFKDH
jgi:arginine repressor